ncbi:MAG: gamma-glutamyl-gamma-aminobutyrate hydrolase family protein [Alphaproteobacteria bacterium]|nr:gamma-glutamyl-gamma-aminobutyrate hydrolase family protein [Alphaproteobacteria bacterium]
MNAPVIGITLDCESGGDAAWSRFPWYALRRHYMDAVAKAGGVPIALPHHRALVDAYLDHVDGLVLTGGDFDIDPSLYGSSRRHATIRTKDERTHFEWALTEKALARDMPVLGICGGMQLLHVILGGTLIQHIPDEVQDALAHEQPNPRDEAGHNVHIEHSTLLYLICGVDKLAVNSAHHQAPKDSPGGVRVSALAPDGVIEGIESTRHRFALGVQWHPEFLLESADERIFAAFVAEAAGMPAAEYAKD